MSAEIEASVSRVSQSDITEPYVWEIDKLYQTERSRIDSYLRTKAKELLATKPQLAEDKLAEKASREESEIRSVFCLSDDKLKDIEVYEMASNGELYRKAPHRKSSLFFHSIAFILAICEMYLFIVQAQIASENWFVPITLGLMLILFALAGGNQIGDAMNKWIRFRSGADDLKKIRQTSERSIPFNIAVSSILLLGILTISIVRSYDGEFSTTVFVLTLSVAVGIIAMETLAKYKNEQYRYFSGLMIKAQRHFASINHNRMLDENQWSQKFISHYRDLQLMNRELEDKSVASQG